MLQANSVQLGQRQIAGRVGGQPSQLAWRQRDVFQHAELWEEIEMLEHHADTLAELVGIVVQHRPAVQQDVAAIGLVQSVQSAQQRRLTGAGRSDDGRPCCPRDVDIDAAQHLVAAEGLVNTIGRQ